MRIMTISASPYLLVRNAKINSSIINFLKESGYDVSSACWHHDEGYFMPDASSGIYSYDNSDGEKVCDIYPFIVHPEYSATQIYEIMKKVAPHVVITIGDHKETNFMYAIRSMYPIFKWISIITLDVKNISEYNLDFLNYSDAVVCLSDFAFNQINGKINQPIFKIPFGPEKEFLKDKQINKIDDRLRVICTSKNALSNDLGNIIKAFSLVSDIADLYLHSNIYDIGEFDIYNLIDIYGAKNVVLPEDYVSIKDGVTCEKMADLYRSSDVVLDCSSRSATALSLLEGMACGCIPLGIGYGAVGDVISKTNYGNNLIINSFEYVGKMEEEFRIASVEGIVEKIIYIYNIHRSNNGLKQDIINNSKKVASEFCKEKFITSFKEALETVIKTEPKISVDTF